MASIWSDAGRVLVGVVALFSRLYQVFFPVLILPAAVIHSLEKGHYAGYTKRFRVLKWVLLLEAVAEILWVFGGTLAQGPFLGVRDSETTLAQVSHFLFLEGWLALRSAAVLTFFLRSPGVMTRRLLVLFVPSVTAIYCVVFAFSGVESSPGLVIPIVRGLPMAAGFCYYGISYLRSSAPRLILEPTDAPE